MAFTVRAFLILVIAALSYAGEPRYVGSAACASCHTETHRKWADSRHSKMLQPASIASVQGDFNALRLKLRGDVFKLRAVDGAYYITESYLTGSPQEHRIDYTLGNRRIQHYLTKLPDGRIIVLPPSWDIQRKEWFHNLDIVNRQETSHVLVQVWNKSCYSCHVSQQEKNFDPKHNTYDTGWLDFGTNCERCHGPGSSHVASPKTPRGMVVQTRLDPARNTMVCAQCHSLRDIVAPGFAAGSNYFDYFLPILEYGQKMDSDPAYWTDGRTRRFSNDAAGIWQSECFLKGGVTCVHCHADPHDTRIEINDRLRPDSNEICARCHGSIAGNPTAHTHHPAGSTGSACVECHMPRTVFSIKAAIRDHSISVPVPENTIRHAIPNACNVCHQDRDAQWTLEKMNRWYGSQSRQKLMRRADAFALARVGDRAAIAPLIAIAAAYSEGPIARANALGHLSGFGADPRVFSALNRALDDPHPLVRAVAALRMEPGAGDRQVAIASLTRALDDSVRTVRAGAVVSLVGLGVYGLPGAAGTRFERAKQEYLARLRLNSDDATERLNAGKFLLLTGDAAGAIQTLEEAVKLQPDVAAQYFLACAYGQQGQIGRARQLLKAIPHGDPYYAAAKKLLQTLTAR